jgi:hypothetical protein
VVTVIGWALEHVARSTDETHLRTYPVHLRVFIVTPATLHYTLPAVIERTRSRVALPLLSPEREDTILMTDRSAIDRNCLADAEIAL